MAEDTIFEKILKKEIPCSVVYEDDHVLAFNDITPQAPIHVLVIPKEKIRSFDAFTSKENNFIAEYIKRIALVAQKLGLSEDGYRVVFNHGQDGGQTVDYIHAHILGKRPLEWPPG